MGEKERKRHDDVCEEQREMVVDVVGQITDILDEADLTVIEALAALELAKHGILMNSVEQTARTPPSPPPFGRG